MAEKIKSSTNLMYIAVIFVILIVIIFMVARPDAAKEDVAAGPDKVYLWNQQEFDDWQFYLQESTADPYQVFTINEGLINILGTPFGYMKTKDVYKDYKLHVEWRWPGEPGNSGVFIHMQDPDTIWPGLIECQLKSGNAGDLVFLGGTDALEREDKSTWSKPKFEDSSEKTAGEWNAYDITARNDSIIVYVNGTLQNIVSQPSVSEGHIGLQSEGAPIEFRNVYIIHSK